MITLKTLPRASTQQVFDQVAKHLLTQRVKSQVLGSCAYRADKLKCAAGCLIADDEYSESMEAHDWIYLVGQHKIPNAHADLISALQTIHDTEEPSHWPAHLLLLGETYKLDVKAVTRFGCWNPKVENCDCPACGGFND